MSMKFIGGIIIFSLIFVGGAYLILSSGNQPQVPIVSYTSNDKEKPVIEAKELSFDMGTIKVVDQKEKIFTIKNIGSKPLQLSNFSTSCGCTAVQFIYQGKTSEEFSMHSQKEYVATISPFTEAHIKVIYRPFVMPVYGLVEREAYVSTNDPMNPKLVFKVKSYVK